MIGEGVDHDDILMLAPDRGFYPMAMLIYVLLIPE
jgi:hypothetical protein